MNVTLVVDASYCPDTRVSGYGFWVVSDKGGFPGQGHMKRLFSNPTLSEMAAIANSLYRCIKYAQFESGDKVLIQTDCIPAIDAFNYSRICRHKDELEILAYFNKLVREYNLVVKFMHVKGHTSSPHPRSLANKACDIRAKKQMRRARNKMKCKMLKDMLK